MVNIGQLQLNKHFYLALIITLLGFALNCYAYYPGFISPDSLDQYQQALTHQYNDWHPPIMAGFWSLLLHLHKGGALMFLIQIFAFWLSFFILYRTALKHFLKLSFIVVLFYFSPFMQDFVGNIWKDVGLAISWLLSISIMIKVHFEKRKLKMFESVICLILLCYGCWIRINALPGVIPLLGLWIYLNRKDIDNSIQTKQFILKIIGLTLLVISLQIGITKLILKPSKTHPEYKLFLHDLTGIYKETGQMYFPSFIIQHEGFDSIYIKQKYIYATFDNIWWNAEHKKVIPDANEEQINELQKCWIKGLSEHPLVYLKNRTKGFLQFLRITNSGSKLEIFYPYIHPNNFSLKFESNKLTQLIQMYIELQRRMPYMQPWFWFLINIVVLFLGYTKQFLSIKYLILGLAYSSLFYIGLEYLVFQADTEFRYFYWNCVSLSLASILILTQLIKEKKSEML